MKCCLGVCLALCSKKVFQNQGGSQQTSHVSVFSVKSCKNLKMLRALELMGAVKRQPDFLKILEVQKGHQNYRFIMIWDNFRGHPMGGTHEGRREGASGSELI